MMQRATKFGTFAFLALTAGVAANLAFMQERHRGAGIETSALGSERARYSETSTPAASEQQAKAPASVAAPTTSQIKAQPQPAVADTSVNKAEIVRGIQRELNTRGYGTGQPDGMPGLVTRAAIMAYEYDYGLALTADPTQDLLSRIVLGTAGPATTFKNQPVLKTPEAEAVVKQVKQFLAGAGYVPGKIEGKLGDDAIRAIRDFELDQKMPETGRISGQLVSRLIKVQGQGKQAAVGK